MAGLNYGYGYRSKKGIRTDRQTGVVYGDKSKKWIVRIKKKNGHVSTIAQFDDKQKAEDCYASAVANGSYVSSVKVEEGRDSSG